MDSLSDIVQVRNSGWKWTMVVAKTQCDSDHQTINEQRTRSSHATRGHTRCTVAGWVGCERRRGLYTWRYCGSRCHMSNSGTTRPRGTCCLVHPRYSRPAHISPPTATQAAELSRQLHSLQRISAAKMSDYVSSLHQLQHVPSNTTSHLSFETDRKKQRHKPQWLRDMCIVILNPVERSGDLQQVTPALVAKTKWYHTLSIADHRPNWRVGCSDCTQLMTFPLNGWRHTARKCTQQQQNV